MSGALDDRTRVLLLGPSLSAVSGISTHLVEILRSPLAADFRLRHFQTGSQGRNESAAGRLVRLAWSPVTFAATLIVQRVALVHVNTSMDRKAFWRDAVYVIVARALGRRVVYQVHGGEPPERFAGRSRPFNAFFRWLLRQPDAIVLLAHSEREGYARFARFDRLDVIPNGIDVTAYLPAREKSFDGPSLRLLYLGALHRAKGVHELVQALAILRDRSELAGLELDIVGGGPAESALKQQVRDLGLEGCVRVAAPVFGKEKLRLWQKAHLFVLPSAHEGLPYALLESLASGTPVIATAVGGVAEAIVDGDHGVLVPPRDAGAVADAIAALRSDPARLRRMSRRCVERARERYTADRLASELRSLYQNVLGPGRSAERTLGGDRPSTPLPINRGGMP
jgi:glycosyltransferase involved in cell wall biosynthesis